jgi:hypothetical protein
MLKNLGRDIAFRNMPMRNSPQLTLRRR